MVKSEHLQFVFPRLFKNPVKYKVYLTDFLKSVLIHLIYRQDWSKVSIYKVYRPGFDQSHKNTFDIEPKFAKVRLKHLLSTHFLLRRLNTLCFLLKKEFLQFLGKNNSAKEEKDCFAHKKLLPVDF